MPAHDMIFGKYCADSLGISEYHVIAGPQDLEAGIKSQKSLEQILFVPVELIVVIDLGIVPWQTDIMNMYENTRGQARENLQVFIFHIIAGSEDMA
jgi:hypothetical protein